VHKVFPATQFIAPRAGRTIRLVEVVHAKRKAAIRSVTDTSDSCQRDATAAGRHYPFRYAFSRLCNRELPEGEARSAPCDATEHAAEPRARRTLVKWLIAILCDRFAD